MDDKEVGELWADSHGQWMKDSGCDEIVQQLIRKLVEKQAVAIGLDNRLWAHSENKAKLIDRALCDFGIDPKTWK